MDQLEEAPAPDGAPGKRTGGRAGRDLPVAIGVGLGLAALITVPLFTYRPAFIAVLVVAVGIGTWELVQAVRTTEADPPLLPLLLGGAAMVVSAYAGGAGALATALLLTVLVSWVWRLAEQPDGYLRDASSSSFVAVYVPFLAGFAALLAAPDDGALRVTAFVATTVCSDVGGYAAGVLLGRHPMAPTVSPKKSWEGLGGSALACAVGGALMVGGFFEVPWWQGALYGLAVCASATVGDLGESMLKRDIGVKDMGTLLPGHGGLMDRLDSLLPTAPVAWVLLTLIAPPT